MRRISSASRGQGRRNGSTRRYYPTSAADRNLGNCHVDALPYSALEVSYDTTNDVSAVTWRSHENWQIQVQGLPRRDEALPDVRARSRGGRSAIVTA